MIQYLTMGMRIGTTHYVTFIFKYLFQETTHLHVLLRCLNANYYYYT